MSRSGPTVHQLYKRLETVGRGAYGSVHKGVEIATGNVVALKIINLDTEDDDVGDIQREVALLTQLRDAPNVTKYYGCYLDGPRVWIVMEYAQGGSVRTLMKACPDGIVEKYTVVVVREVLAALAYLHRSGIIHRDIKAANILITATGKVMICDFGVSALLTTATSKRNTFIGTPYWMAPEVAQAVPNYDTKADIWSLGILVYEMAKGSPPHSNLDAARVLQLLPRTRAPRLVEGEGSKDMREFVSLCLKESPVDRLPAEELSKTKWIKMTGKTPNAILKELLIRYDAWSEGGGTRTSLADPLGWEDEENQPDRRSLSLSDAWQFDTVKSMGGLRESIDDEFSPSLLAPEAPMQSSTIRPTQPSKVPVSLRSLFPEESSDANESLVTPAPFQYPPTLAPPTLLIPTTSGQSRTPRKQKRLGEAEDDDLQHTHRAGFVFPPRPKQATDVEKPPEQMANSPKFSSPPTPYHHPVEEKSTRFDDGKAEPAQISPVRDFARNPIERKRSKSNAADTNVHIFPSHGEYRFPMSTGLPSGVQRPLQLLSGKSRRSPTLDSLDRTHASHSHQSSHSLDAVPSGRASPSTSHPTSNITRPLPQTLNDSPDGLNSGSKPPPLKPSLVRQASVAVMETVSSPPLLPPVPPLVRQRQRSGNSVSGNSDFLSPNVPGLKDVLKVPHLTSEHQLGMADLLPPSPSAFGPTNTKACPSPTPINSTPGSNPLSSSLSNSLSASAKSTPRSRSRSPPPPLDFSQPSPNYVADGVEGRLFAPPIRPLDLGSLMGSRDDTHAELARIVEDLAQWLAVVENGLSDLLATPAVDTIEEEQEDLGGYYDEHDEFSSGLEDQYETQNDILSTPHAFLSHSGLPS